MGEDLRLRVLALHAHEPHFQSVLIEFLSSVIPYMESIDATADDYALLERLTVPERVIAFKVVWEDDNGKMQHNLGYRVQFNSALGPYKGGLRFDPSVSIDILSFLGFEQIFKNALTGLPMGGGKGGSDFNPKGKSDAEIRRFSVAFMQELARFIGAETDVPAGDIGVGAREIGYMYGALKKLTNRTDGTLTGKGVGYGGSHVRTEATGYGVVYFIQEMLRHAGKDIAGMRVVISGSGNVATHVAEKMLYEGAIPLTLSDREGYIYAQDGLTHDVVDAVKHLKDARGALKDLSLPEGVTYHEGSVWGVSADVYVPSATQHEVHKEDAERMIANGALLVAEAANMPCTLDAVEAFQEAGVLFGPAKAVNAGGVAVSGLEMSQNAMHLQWRRKEVDERLQEIMKEIHKTCVEYGEDNDKVDYVKGASVGGFVRVLSAMKSLGM
jgi:glutamate dehydrogenase (NADP+)